METPQKEAPGKWSHEYNDVTIRPVVNGWLVKEGPKVFVFLDQDALMKHLISSTTNQRKSYNIFLESLKSK